MRLPFTTEQFFDVFVRYHEAVWPAPLVLVALALVAVLYAVRDRPRDGRRVNAILAALWLWMAVMYHVAFFATVNRAAILFAILFGVQAWVFARLAVSAHTVAYRPRADAAGIAGAAFILYALIGYPLLGYFLGHRYPASPTFGVPCPTTIFTLGLLLWSTGISARFVAVVPLLWAIVATSAAVNLGVKEDLGLSVAAVVTFVLLFGRRQRSWARATPLVATPTRR